MVKICGLDPSLVATGYAELSDGGEHMDTLSVGKLKAEQRIAWIVQAITERCADAGLVVMEGLSFGARSTSAHELAGLHWALRLALSVHETRYIVVAPALLKKFATGKGNAKKEVVMMDVSRRWGIRPEDSNQADAFVLAKTGACILGIEEPTTNAQREVIAKLTKEDH
jgi:crossover junction endodeoxyribonuclease RuvC